MRLAELRLHFGNEIHTCGLIDMLWSVVATLWVSLCLCPYTYLPSFGHPMLYVNLINAHKQAPVGIVPL